MVNNRNLGARGSLSRGFGSGSALTREKMELRHLMAKSKTQTMENNPIAKRRMEQKIAAKAGELYRIDPKKLMHGGSQTVTSSSGFASNVNLSDNYGLRDRINAAKNK